MLRIYYSADGFLTCANIVQPTKAASATNCYVLDVNIEMDKEKRRYMRHLLLYLLALDERVLQRQLVLLIMFSAHPIYGHQTQPSYLQ
jgi:hypothetical protein